MVRLAILGPGDKLDQKHLPAHLDPATMTATSAVDRARANHTGTQASTTISDFSEAVQDAVSVLLAQGTGVTLSYNDAGNTLTVSSTGTGGVSDPEVVRDTIGTALLGVGLIAVAVNDAADTITITTTATINDTDANLKARANHTGLLPLAGAAAGSRFTAPLNGVANTVAGTARPSTRTDIFFDWISTVRPTAMITGDTWAPPGKTGIYEDPADLGTYLIVGS